MPMHVAIYICIEGKLLYNNGLRIEWAIIMKIMIS